MGGTAGTTASIFFPDGPRRAVGRTLRHGAGEWMGSTGHPPPRTPPFTDLQRILCPTECGGVVWEGTDPPLTAEATASRNSRGRASARLEAAKRWRWAARAPRTAKTVRTVASSCASRNSQLSHPSSGRGPCGVGEVHEDASGGVGGDGAAHSLWRLCKGFLTVR